MLFFYPELALPVVETTESPGEVALDVLHEGGQLRCAGRGHEQVKVVAHEAVIVELDIEPRLRMGQDADDDGVGLSPDIA